MLELRFILNLNLIMTDKGGYGRYTLRFVESGPITCLINIRKELKSYFLPRQALGPDEKLIDLIIT